MIRKFATLLSVTVLTVACAQTDAGITAKVKSQMAADDTVKAYQIDVDTQEKVVTLRGSVQTAAAKEQAVQIARSTQGVQDVIDQLSVDTTAPTTGRLDDLGGDLRRGADATGDAARDAADRLGDSARHGADSVGDAADRAGDALSDAAVTSAVKTKLLADDTVRGLNIDVDTNNGTVVLNGDVASRAEASQAIRLAQGTDGVKKVVDNLKVGKYVHSG